MNESEEELVWKACALILVEVLTTSWGKSVYFDSLGMSPTKGFFTLNKVPKSVIELLQEDSEKLDYLKSLKPKEGKWYLVFPDFNSEENAKSLQSEISNFPDPRKHLICI